MSLNGYFSDSSEDYDPEQYEIVMEICRKMEDISDITDKRLHHEIYLSDARKVAPEKLKTVIRHPIRKA